MKTTYEPTQNFLIVKPITPEAMSKGGIVIPDMAQRTISEGIIIKVGPLCVLGLMPGQEVVFDQHSEFRIRDTDTDEAFFVVQETNVIICKPAKRNLNVAEALSAAPQLTATDPT